jgi:acyl-CoA thioesterase FadM
MDTDPALRFVTGSIHVDYLAPTPLGVPLELRGTVSETGPKKVVVDIRVSAEGTLCAKGRVIAVKMPDTMMTKK